MPDLYLRQKTPLYEMISKRCTYSLQSLVYLTKEQSERFVPTRQISEALSIPASYLAKILSDLANRHFVKTRKGAQGGAMLLADPSTLSVRDVVVAIDGPGLVRCIGRGDDS